MLKLWEWARQVALEACCAHENHHFGAHMIGETIQRIDRLARYAALRLYVLLWLLVAARLMGWAWFGETGPGLFGYAL